MTTLHLTAISKRDVWRWAGAAVLMVIVHAAVVAAGIQWSGATSQGVPLDTISVDLAPVSSASEVQNLDLPPGPPQEQSEPPAPEPEKKTVDDTIPATPEQEKAEVAAPPEEKPKPQTVVEKPQPVEKKPKKPSDVFVPRTTAPPKAQTVAPVREARLGDSATMAALPEYKQQLAAHIRRFKQYPASARAASETGLVTVAVTVTGSGGATGMRVVHSSGHPTLDADAVETIRRALPLPPPPGGTAMSFTLPLSYSLH